MALQSAAVALTYLQVDPDYELWKLGPIAKKLSSCGVGVIPTDTVYAFVCDLGDKAAIERLYAIKQLDPKKPLAILCKDLAAIAEYTRGVPNNHFRALRRCVPGPFTFILQASAAVPKLMLTGKRRELGVRIPADPICHELLAGGQRRLRAEARELPSRQSPKRRHVLRVACEQGLGLSRQASTDERRQLLQRGQVGLYRRALRLGIRRDEVVAQLDQQRRGAQHRPGVAERGQQRDRGLLRAGAVGACAVHGHQRDHQLGDGIRDVEVRADAARVTPTLEGRLGPAEQQLWAILSREPVGARGRDREVGGGRGG